MAGGPVSRHAGIRTEVRPIFIGDDASLGTCTIDTERTD